MALPAMGRGGLRSLRPAQHVDAVLRRAAAQDRRREVGRVREEALGGLVAGLVYRKLRLADG